MKRHCTPQDLLHKVQQVASSMVAHHDCDHLAASVLHDLSDPQCFPLERIAFFVDNPDFDLLRGVAGADIVGGNERFAAIWDDRPGFAAHLEHHPFHQRVRAIEQGSVHRRQCAWQGVVDDISDVLEVASPSWYAFRAKHGNHGVLVYKMADGCTIAPGYLEMTAALLGLCPLA